MSGELRRLPNQITCLRIVLTGMLHWVVFTDSRAWFLGLYAVAFLSDVLDGYLARRLGQQSYFGMRLDSYADYFLMASSVWWAWRLCPGLFLENRRLWWAIAATLAVPQAVAFHRLGRNAGFHLYSTKLAGWLAFALFVHAVAFGYNVFLLYALAAAVAVKSAEETAICLLVADHGADAATSNFLLAAFDSLGFEASAAQAQALASNGIEPGVRVESHVLSNTGGRTAAYLIPGLITILVQTIVALLMGLSIASERERGTLEQLLVTPIGRDAIIGGKAAAVAAIGLVECVVLTLLMRHLFGIPVAGSLWLLVSIVPLLVLLPLGLGLLIAAAARNHSHAIQMGNLILTPSILLSGFVFPREFLHFPFDEISRVLPTTYFVQLSRDIILRGTPAADLLPALAWTAGLALVLLPSGYLALRRSLAV